jgi:hypothetical protein
MKYPCLGVINAIGPEPTPLCSESAYKEGDSYQSSRMYPVALMFRLSYSAVDYIWERVYWRANGGIPFDISVEGLPIGRPF